MAPQPISAMTGAPSDSFGMSALRDLGVRQSKTVANRNELPASLAVSACARPGAGVILVRLDLNCHHATHLQGACFPGHYVVTL